MKTTKKVTSILHNKSQLEQNQLSTSVVNQVKNQLNTVNNNIKENGLIIDPDTKEIVKYSPYIMFAAGVRGANRLSSGCYVYVFWWGARFYFTSNAAVSWFRGKLSTGSSIASLASAVSLATGHGITSTLTKTLGMYADSMSNRLNNYNKAHKHSKIYMDVNFGSIYSFHTF